MGELGELISKTAEATAALTQKSSKTADRPWTVEVDGPRWALGERADRHLQPFLLLIAAGIFMTLGLAALLTVVLFVSSSASGATRDILTAALVGSVAFVLLVARSAISRNTKATLRLRVSAGSDPLPPSTVGSVTTKTEPDASGHVVTTTVAPASSTAPSGQPPVAGEAKPAETGGTPAPSQGPPTPVATFLAREPVLIQAAILVAGALVLGFAVKLSPETLAGIVAAAAAALGVLVRNSTTPITDPRDASGQALSAPPSPSPTQQ